MNCSRRIYKGNAYEICLPLVDSGVTLVRIYTRGDVIIEKEPEITADSMCIQLTADELAGLADGVIRYEAITDTDAYVTNSPYILITPDWYSGRTLDDIIQDAYDSGYTDGYEDCGGSGGYDSGYTDGYADGYEVGYESGYTDGLAACESGDTGDTPTAETRFTVIYSATSTSYATKILGDSGLTAFSKIELEDGTEIPLSSTYVFPSTGLHKLYLTPADPESTEVPDYAFGHHKAYVPHSDGAAVYSITIPDGYTSIGYRCFLGCAKLTSVDFPSGMTSFDAFAFEACSHLNIEIPETLTSWGRSCFAYCTSLTGVTIPSGVTDIPEQGFAGCTGLRSIVIPSNVTGAIGASAFSGCNNLRSITIEAATSMGQAIFANCSSLTGITIPSSVTVMQGTMFGGCSGLTEVTMENPEPPHVGSGAYSPTLFGDTGYTFPIYVPCESITAYKEAFPNYASRIRCSGPYDQQYLTLQAIEDGYIRLHSMDNNPKGQIHVRKNYGEWEDYDQWTALRFDCVSGDTFEFRAAMDSYWAVNFGSSTAKFNAYGNIWSLVFDDELPENDGFWYSVDYLFSNLFLASRLVDASNLWLGGRNTFIPPHGFEYTFSTCNYFVAAPELPMMNLGEYAYNCMFYGCSQLEVAPELPYNNPPTGAYERMFYRCGNLQYIKCDASNTGMTDEWVREVAGYGIFIQAPGVEWSTGWSGIPSGWDRYDYLFESDVKSITAHPEATSVTITIKSVYSWTRTSQPDWARTNRVSGQPGEATVRINIESATSPRFGDIIFTDEKGNTIKISVTQAEMPIIWVDDFPDGTSEDWGYAEPYDPDFCQEFYEHESFDAYLDDYLADKQYYGCNKYKIYGEMNFEGVDYWIYRMVNPETDEFYKVDEMPVAQGLLPKSTNLEEYRSKSMASDHTAFYPAFAHYLMDDGTEYDNDIIDGGGYVLVDTE